MSSNPFWEKPLRYGWVVVFVSAIVNSLAWSVRSISSVFYVALLGEFAWRRGEAAIGYSLSWLLLLVFSPLAGWLYDRWGARLGIAGFGCLGWLDGPEDFLLLLAYVVAGVGFGTRISLLAAIPADLFAGRHLGVILGAAQGGGDSEASSDRFSAAGSSTSPAAIRSRSLSPRLPSPPPPWPRGWRLPVETRRRDAPPAGSVCDAGRSSPPHARSDTADADVSLGGPRAALRQRAAGLLHPPSVPSAKSC